MINRIILIVIISIFVISCEDSSLSDYKEDFIVEALLVVGEPINNITVMRSQPVSGIFNYDSSMVKDANVKIIGDGKEFDLKFRPKEFGSIGYFSADTTYIVKSGIEYKIEITLNNGKFITGKTTTPPATSWIYLPDELVQYPLDTLNIPQGDSISWQAVVGFPYYMISIKNMDTLNYGIYLNPPTDELNRRIYRPFGGGERAYRDPISIFPIPSNKTPVLWTAFRWFGKHQIKIYVPDFNFLRWFLQAQTKGEADPLLTSVDGAIGYFGSASVIQYDFFLLKNQP